MIKKSILAILAISLGASCIPAAALRSPHWEYKTKCVRRFDSKLIHYAGLGAWAAGNLLLLKSAYNNLKEMCDKKETKKKRRTSGAKLAAKTTGCYALNLLAFAALYKKKTTVHRKINWRALINQIFFGTKY